MEHNLIKKPLYHKIMDFFELMVLCLIIIIKTKLLYWSLHYSIQNQRRLSEILIHINCLEFIFDLNIDRILRHTRLLTINLNQLWSNLKLSNPYIHNLLSYKNYKLINFLYLILKNLYISLINNFFYYKHHFNNLLYKYLYINLNLNLFC